MRLPCTSAPVSICQLPGNQEAMVMGMVSYCDFLSPDLALDTMDTTAQFPEYERQLQRQWL